MRDGVSTALQPPLRSSVAAYAVCTEAMYNHFMKDITKNYNNGRSLQLRGAVLLAAGGADGPWTGLL